MNRSLRFPALFLACAVGALSTNAAVAAPPTERSQQLRAEGNKLMDERRFDEALQRYEEAQRLAPDDAAILYNLSRIHELRGDAVRALEFMEQFQARATAELKARVGQVDALLDGLRSKVARVRVECEGPPALLGGDALERALVLVDGRVVATGCRAHDLKLKAGIATFVVSAEGYVARSVRAELVGGANGSVRLEIAPRDKSGVLRLKSEPEHVRVEIAGRELGETPLELLLPSGPHRLELGAPGYKSLTLPVVVEASVTKDLELVRLEKEASVFTRWWFWTGAAAVVAGGVTAAILLTTERDPDKGTISPGTARFPLSRW